MHTQRSRRMDMGGRNYLAKECADILMRILVWMLEWFVTIMCTDHMEHLAEEGKKPQQHYVEKLSKLNKKEIDVWGDGEQSRSFLYIEDCIEGTETVFNKSYKEPLNIGSDEQVSINQMIAMIEEIADYKVKKNYQLDKPLGVRGRSSDNSLTIEKIGWKPSYTLKQGLEKTYKWIYEQLTTNKSNSQKFTQTLDKSG